MSNNSQPTIVKQLIEFLPLGVFFATFTATKDLILATYFLLGSTAIMLAIILLIYKKIEKMSLIVSISIFVFGGLTLAFDDTDFIKLKLTILNSVLALVFFFAPFFFQKKTIIEMLLGAQLKLPANAWKLMNNMWIVYFILTAVVNLLIYKLMSEDAWVAFRFWGMMGFTLSFSVIQVALLYKYLKEQS